MRVWVGNKTYDIEKAELIHTMPDGIQVYRKRGRSAGSVFFLYNPKGHTLREKYFDLPPEEAVSYLPEYIDIDYMPKSSHIKFSPEDSNRIRRLAISVGMAMNKFIMMLVDEYEKKHRPQ